jgi:hypothetical protein
MRFNGQGQRDNAVRRHAGSRTRLKLRHKHQPGAAGWVRAAAVACVLTFFLAVPAAAQAAFSARAASTLTATTAVLTAPDATATNVSTSCTSTRGYSQPRITVTAFGKVAGANYHELKVASPNGQTAFTGDLSTSSGSAYSSLTTATSVRGTWTYEIRGYYKIPGTTRTWTGKALTGTFTCP